LPRRAEEAGHVRVHERYAYTSAGNPNRDRAIGSERQFLIGYSRGNFLQLPDDGGDLPGAATLHNGPRRVFDAAIRYR
jgi:hypothetical protein